MALSVNSDSGELRHQHGCSVKDYGKSHLHSTSILNFDLVYVVFGWLYVSWF